MKSYILGFRMTLLLLHCVLAMVPNNSIAAEEEFDAIKPYQIIVRPTMSRAVLRSLIVNVEDDFFDKFNELNLDDAYDVVCYKFVPTGSHISRRVCEPNFFIATRSENSGEFMAAFGTCRTCQNWAPPLLSRQGLRTYTKTNFEVLEQKMQTLNDTNDELRDIGSVLTKLKSRLKNFKKD